MPKQSKNLKTQPSEQPNLLAEAAAEFDEELRASGYTVRDLEPSDTETLTVNFVARRATKPSEPPAE